MIASDFFIWGRSFFAKIFIWGRIFFENIMLTNLVRILESILIYYLQEGLFLKNPMKKGENLEKNS